MEKKKLKKHLSAIKKNHFCKDEQYSYEDYAVEMLAHIGDTDAELRDEFIYEVFDAWISDGKYTTGQMIQYLNICLDQNHLLHGISDHETDSVFSRTFSALIIASILYVHHQRTFLTEHDILNVYQTFTKYYHQEKDYRGYITEGGWAHAVAHGADVLKELAKCQELQKDELLYILELIRQKVCQGKYVFIDREPNRMAWVVNEIMKRDEITESDIVSWIQQFSITEQDKQSVLYYHQRVNIENFFRVLYFEVKKLNQMSGLLYTIEEKTEC